MSEHTRDFPTAQASRSRSRLLSELLFQFCRPLLCDLDRRLDRRLVETFLALLTALLLHRHRQMGLVLSELGGFLESPAHAPAGTKRISNLLRSRKWSAELLEAFFWQHADSHVDQLTSAQETALVVWDESVLEKPESLKLEGLSPVRSVKTVRLQRIKPGYFNPPSERPTFVPGFHWLAILVMGFQGAPTLAHFAFWSTRGEEATDKRTLEWKLLAEIAPRWGRRVLHIWDRGFAGRPWLTFAQGLNVRFVVRWTKRAHLLDEFGQSRTAGEIMRGKRSRDHKLVWDARRREWRKAGIRVVRVYDPDLRRPLWLVASRFGAGRKTWYLVTNEPVETLDAAWRIVFAYARRWQVEMTLRFDKSELALESARVRGWDTRLKLLGLVALAYAFLLSLLGPVFESLCSWLLEQWCHRTGKWTREVSAPLYRLRSALSRLWLAHPTPLLRRLNSG